MSLPCWVLRRRGSALTCTRFIDIPYSSAMGLPGLELGLVGDYFLKNGSGGVYVFTTDHEPRCPEVIAVVARGYVLMRVSRTFALWRFWYPATSGSACIEVPSGTTERKRNPE